MALATKCPHCNTIFRVAHDQLKLRGGIVRCGSCHQVFDGNAALLEPLAPPVSAALPSVAAPPAALPTAIVPSAAEPDELDLDFDDLDDDPLAPPPLTAATDVPDTVAALSLEFDDAPVAPPVAGALPVTAPPPAAGPALLPEPEPSAQDLLSGDTLSEQELQAAIEAELAALDARMAAAQPAPALPPTPAPPRSDERREPTFDFTPQPDGLDEEDEQALLQLAAGATKPYHDIPPSHTLLRTVSAPPTNHYDEPQFHSTESLVAEPVADRHTFEPAGSVQADQAANIEETDDEPGFVKRERHRERYGRATTIALCLGIVLMLGALAAQALTTFRNPLAAAMPSLKPALVAACNAFGCKVELPSQIDELAIEQGELQTLSENTFSFSTALKNSSGSAQAWPHIELVLDDANDKTVLRRVFGPRDYLDREVDIAQGFPASSEQPVKLYFELKQPRVSGYHIAVFYP